VPSEGNTLSADGDYLPACADSVFCNGRSGRDGVPGIGNQVPAAGDEVSCAGYEVPAGTDEVPPGGNCLRPDTGRNGLPACGYELQCIAGSDDLPASSNAVPACANSVFDEWTGADSLPGERNQVPGCEYEVSGISDEVPACGDAVFTCGNGYGLSSGGYAMPAGADTVRDEYSDGVSGGRNAMPAGVDAVLGSGTCGDDLPDDGDAVSASSDGVFGDRWTGRNGLPGVGNEMPAIGDEVPGDGHQVPTI